MLIQLLNEMVPLVDDIVVGSFVVAIINAVRKLLTKTEDGTYSIKISFSKVGK